MLTTGILTSLHSEGSLEVYMTDTCMLNGYLNEQQLVLVGPFKSCNVYQSSVRIRTLYMYHVPVFPNCHVNITN